MRNRLSEQIRHPAVAFVGVLFFASAAVVPISGSIDAANQIALADDPVAFYDQAVDRVLDKARAEKEIQEALTTSDADMAQSLFDVALSTMLLSIRNSLTKLRKRAPTLRQRSRQLEGLPEASGPESSRTRPALRAFSLAICLSSATSVTLRAKVHAT
jgi:hypothetical protein